MTLVEKSVVFLSRNHRRCRPIHLVCGLPQGGALSALLFVLFADSFLRGLGEQDDIEVVLGFVDD